MCIAEGQQKPFDIESKGGALLDGASWTLQGGDDYHSTIATDKIASLLDMWA